MRSALSGDQVAYRKLLSGITPHVRRIVRRNLQKSHIGVADVEDVVQDTLLAVHLKRATWDPTLPFLPWLNAVARHKSIDALRRRGGPIELELDAAARDMAAPEHDRDTGIDVKTALATLDARQLKIVEQISLDGRTAAEVGAALGMSEGAVRVALHRALKALSARFSGSQS